jgi:LysR family transcriptional regulator, nod-box dependent transcriptional activator
VNLVQFDLNLLVALDALLRERNVTRAGQRIGLSQPAMSGTLARLREVFHDELLVRVGRNLELTPLAQELCEPLRQCIVRIEDMMDHRRLFRAGAGEPQLHSRRFGLCRLHAVAAAARPAEPGGAGRNREVYST